jgi:hypothetical protein
MRVLTIDDIFVGADILNERLYVVPDGAEEKELYTRALVPVSVLREILEWCEHMHPEGMDCLCCRKWSEAFEILKDKDDNDRE